MMVKRKFPQPQPRIEAQPKPALVVIQLSQLTRSSRQREREKNVFYVPSDLEITLPFPGIDPAQVQGQYMHAVYPTKMGHINFQQCLDFLSHVMGFIHLSTAEPQSGQ
jgi:hypothetical protein